MIQISLAPKPRGSNMSIPDVRVVYQKYMDVRLHQVIPWEAARLCLDLIRPLRQ